MNMGGNSTADVMAAALSGAGVSHVFAYPGDPIIGLMESLRVSGIEVVLARREGTAAFMAEGLAMATGNIGACLSTLGPGSTAMVNGVAAATLDRVPMVAISGQIETAREQFFTHQVVDHKLLYSPIVKWAGRVEASAAATTMRKAISLAAAERPGAVHLTVASDTSALTATDSHFVPPPVSASATTISVRRSAAGADPLAMLKSARRPIILAGIGAVRAGATESLVQFAETVSAPVIVSPMSKGIFPEEHPLFAGVLDMACQELLWQFLAESDLVIAAGFDAVELFKPWTISAPVLHIDSLANTDQIYASGCECVGDVGAILAWLAEEWRGEARWSTGDVAVHRDRLTASYYAGRVDGRLNPTDVIDSVWAAAPDDTIATCDVGSHKLLVGQGWRTATPRSVLMTNGLSSMGFGVPAAIGAKIAHPTRPVVAMVGDGGFAMTATEVRLAASLKLPIVFVVFADGSLNRIELKQMAQQLPSTATRIDHTDLAMMAMAMGCDGVRVKSQWELDEALAGWSELTGPLVVDAQVDRSQYESQF